MAALPAAFWIATAAATAISAYGSIQQGNAQKKMAEANAQAAEADAMAARNSAAFEETRLREAGTALLSKQRAGYAAAGVQPTGSPLLVEANTAGLNELDALATRYSGSVAEARARSQAALDRMQGSLLQTASRYQAATSLLSGASKGAYYMSA